MDIRDIRDIRDLWRRACAFDSVDPRSSFVVFSAANELAKQYDRAMALILKAKRERENDFVISHIH